MSIEFLEDNETDFQKESPVPALRKDLEALNNSEARQKLEEYVASLPAEPPHCWLASAADTASDPIELVIDLCRKICEIAAASGPFLFPDPSKDQLKRVKKRTGDVRRHLNGSLTILKKARRFSDYYSSGDPSPGEPGPITDADIELVGKVIDRAWRWHEFAWVVENLDLPLPEKRTEPGRPALDHVNELEWRLWELLRLTGMTRRMASKHIKRHLAFYDLSERPWETIEQRLIKQEKSFRS